MSILQSRELMTAAALAASMLLAACDNDTGSTALPGDDHDHDHAESTSGRLVFTTADGTNSRVYVHDLDEAATVADFALTYPASAVHASPGGRYALVMQRDNDQVELLDSGVFPHDDHVDVLEPSMLGYVLSGVRPTHYRVNGDQAALFYDGNADAGILSRFELLTDASLGNGGVLASQSLDTAHHGIAEPLGGLVLSSHSPAAGGPADGISVYALHNDHFHGEGALATSCPGLHGGASNEAWSAFGCEDGVLLAELHDDHFHESKAAVGERIALVMGSHDVPHFAGFAYPSYNLYEIEPETASASQVDWRDGAVDGAGEPVTAVLYGFDPHGEHLLILDNAGTLHVLDAMDWERLATIALIDPIEEGAPAPALAFSGAEHHAFITDPANQSVRVIDLETLAESDEAIQLDIVPANLAWTGVVEGDHDHDHDHEDEHDHEGEHDH